MNPFIVFEGLNGCGKTTLAKRLAKNINGTYIASPHASIRCLRDTVDDEVSISARFLYYMLGNVLISDEVKVVRKSHTVICDRYVHSTIARHKLLGLNVDIDHFAALGIEVPCISFFIFTSDETERRKRVEKRGKKTKWDTLDENEKNRTEYVDYFREKPKFIFVDTSHETAEESLAKIMAVLSERKIV